MGRQDAFHSTVLGNCSPGNGITLAIEQLNQLTVAERALLLFNELFENRTNMQAAVKKARQGDDVPAG
jgi:hypothetical protein